MTDFSIVPPNLKERDPRPFAFLFPGEIRNDDQSFVAFMKRVQRFDFYNTLKMFEEYAHANGFILFPASIMHWRRRSEFGEGKRVRVGRKSFYLVREYELTIGEKEKLSDYIKDVRRERI